jgi:hypothetical protein
MTEGADGTRFFPGPDRRDFFGFAHNRAGSGSRDSSIPVVREVPPTSREAGREDRLLS